MSHAHIKYHGIPFIKIGVMYSEKKKPHTIFIKTLTYCPQYMEDKVARKHFTRGSLLVERVWWLILCVTLAKPWCPPESRSCSEGIWSWWFPLTVSWLKVKQAASSNQLKALRTNTEEGSFPWRRNSDSKLERRYPTWVPNLPACPAD